MKFMEFFVELLGWVRIVLSPLLIGLILGVIVYLNVEDVLGFYIALALTTAGLITGVWWATKEWKRKGTIDFLSKVMATPELDKKEEGNTTD
jgi:hypothetical protein